MDLDRMHWLDHGLHEIESAETLEDALEEASALVVRAGVQLADAAEMVVLTRGHVSQHDGGHPLVTAVREFRIAHAALTDVHADLRQRREWAR